MIALIIILVKYNGNIYRYKVYPIISSTKCILMYKYNESIEHVFISNTLCQLPLKYAERLVMSTSSIHEYSGRTKKNIGILTTGFSENI